MKNEEEKAFKALHTLRLLWREYVGDDFKIDDNKRYYAIYVTSQMQLWISAMTVHSPFLFNNYTEAELFLEQFKDLLEEAKILL